MPQFRGDSDDFAPGIVRIRADLLANCGVRRSPILAGEILGYDYDPPALVNLGPSEFPPRRHLGPQERGKRQAPRL